MNKYFNCKLVYLSNIIYKFIKKVILQYNHIFLFFFIKPKLMYKLDILKKLIIVLSTQIFFLNYQFYFFI